MIVRLVLEFLNGASVTLKEKSPQEILEWAAKNFPNEIAASSSFQTQSVPLLHMIASTVPQLPILFIDTGYHFPETIAFRDRLVHSWNLNLEVLTVRNSMEEGLWYANQPLYLTNPDLCCEIHKVAPMREAMRRYRVWISGIRRDQSHTRAKADIVEVSKENRIRIHPMLEWTQSDVQQYVRNHGLPEHPLDVLGYVSIGCAPCTRPPLTGGGLRSGRWQGTGKTECGLHTHLRDVSKKN
ncbi:Adenosine 5'-phosphosulfate reductase [Gammaproteobacteria bacterium]